MDKNFVAPGPQAVQPVQPAALAGPVQPIAPKLIVESHNRLIDLYADQVKRVAAAGPVVDMEPTSYGGRGLSGAHELAERRKTARLYLIAATIITALTVGGVVGLARVAGMVGDVQAVMVWMVGTGGIVSMYVLHLLRQEQELSPEGLERLRMGYDAVVAQQDADTRRAYVDGLIEVEKVKVQAQADATAAQRAAAEREYLQVQRQIAEQMRQHTTPQHTMNRLNNYRPARPQNAQNGLETRADTSPIGYDLEDDAGALQAVVEAMPEPQPGTVVTDPVRVRLLHFAADLYMQRDPATGERLLIERDGTLRNGVIVPWSKRGGMTEKERAQALAILRQIDPPLFIYDETARRWRLNVQRYRTPGHATHAVHGAYTPMME